MPRHAGAPRCEVQRPDIDTQKGGGKGEIERGQKSFFSLGWKMDHVPMIFLRKEPFTSGISQPARFDYQKALVLDIKIWVKVGFILKNLLNMDHRSPKLCPSMLPSAND